MVKRFLIVTALVGVFVCGLMVFTAQTTSAHGLQFVRGARLDVIREHRTCEHVVEFYVRDAGHHRYRVSGPEHTHPHIIFEHGNVVIAQYQTRGNECRPDRQHRAGQFILEII